MTSIFNGTTRRSPAAAFKSFAGAEAMVNHRLDSGRSLDPHHCGRVLSDWELEQMRDPILSFGN